MSKPKFDWKMLTELEKLIFRAFGFKMNSAMNAQGAYQTVCFLVVCEPDDSGITIDESEVEKLKKVTAADSRKFFSDFKERHSVKLPSYPTIKKYLMRFAKYGWLEEREFSPEKHILVYRVSDEVKKAILKEDKDFFGGAI